MTPRLAAYARSLSPTNAATASSPDDAYQKPLHPAPHEISISTTVERDRWDTSIQRAQASRERGRDYRGVRLISEYVQPDVEARGRSHL